MPGDADPRVFSCVRTCLCAANPTLRWAYTRRECALTLNTAAIVIAGCVGLACLVGAIKALVMLCRAMLSRNKCARCGFSREGLPTKDAVCPECGTAIGARTSIVRVRCARVGVWLVLLSGCAWLIAEWTIGPVVSDRIALMTNPPLTDARVLRLTVRLPKPRSFDPVPLNAVDARARRYAKYALAKLIESEPSNPDENALALIEQVAMWYDKGDQYICTLALERTLDDLHRIKILSSCTPSVPMSWEDAAVSVRSRDPVFTLLAQIETQPQRIALLRSFLSRRDTPSNIGTDRAQIAKFAFSFQYVRAIWDHHNDFDPLFFELPTMWYMVASCGNVTVMVDGCIRENSIATDVLLLCGIAKLEGFLAMRDVVGNTPNVIDFSMLDNDSACYETIVQRVREYLATLSADRRAEILRIASPWAAGEVKNATIDPLESYFPDT